MKGAPSVTARGPAGSDPGKGAMGHAVAVSESGSSSEQWQSWLERLKPERRAAARMLRAQFDALGAADAGGWARSEIDEDIPQLARFVLLRSLWRGVIDGWGEADALEQLPAARRLVAGGADLGDLRRVMRAVAFESVFATLDELDAGGDVNVSGVDVGWSVIETGEDGGPTGRVLRALHEDLSGTDPSGRDGADLWQ